MPFKRSTFASRSKVALSVIAVACALSAPAQAGPGSAPIVFKGTGMNAAAPVRLAQASILPSPQAKQSPADKATARIEFRYPDSQPGGGAVMTASTSTMPLARTASENAMIEAPRVVLPRAPVVESVSLQAMPELAGKGMGYTPLAPVAQPTAPADVNAEFAESGRAVVYGEEFAGLPTANGEIFSQAEMTAAHPSLPLPSLVHVTNLDTGREVVVRVNDRGPFEDGASLQLSRKAAEALGLNPAGKGHVRLRYLSPAPVLPAQPYSQKSVTPDLPPVKTPAAAPAPVLMASAPAAEDELLGAGPFPAPAPRLMSMKVAPRTAAYTAPAVASGNVFVQLASFSEIGNAEAMLRSVEGYHRVEIVPARVNGADFFRVRVGPFTDRAAAEQVRSNFYASGTADGRIVTGY